jgi:hypothetical protein
VSRDTQLEIILAVLLLAVVLVVATLIWQKVAGLLARGKRESESRASAKPPPNAEPREEVRVYRSPVSDYPRPPEDRPRKVPLTLRPVEPTAEDPYGLPAVAPAPDSEEAEARGLTGGVAPGPEPAPTSAPPADVERRHRSDRRRRKRPRSSGKRRRSD